MLPKKLLKVIFIALGFVVSGAAALLALGLYFGGPRAIAAKTSINAPFKSLDYRSMPATQRYGARDGAALAYRHYASSVAKSPQRIVLIHGSSASSRSMHPLAAALAAAGFSVDALDIRGHGESGERGQISYVGQLEDDLTDFMRATAYVGPSTLMGFSSGGGFTLRFSASKHSDLFDRYILLAPYLLGAPINRENNGEWTSVGIPRIIALSVLNKLGVTAGNRLLVTQFALDAEAKKLLTAGYSFALASNFGTHRDYAQDIERAPSRLKIIAGADDDLIFTQRYKSLFEGAGKTVPIALLEDTNHIGLTLNAAALQYIAASSKSATER